MTAPRKARGELVRVLVVDDEADIRELVDLTLSRMGLAADCVGTIAEARKALNANRYQLCLTDMRLPDGDGVDLVTFIAEHHGGTPVAMITAFGSMESAVRALKAGAFDYVAKPIGIDALRALVRSALNVPTGTSTPGRQITGASAAAEQVRQMIDKLSRSQAAIYISGESGTGKELAARLIHEHSARASHAFIPVNCGAIPENLMESEFFGYRKGAFTGADQDREGFFQAADGGTLFLDEVADLPLAMQVKLLRAIQERKVRRVGAAAEEAVDVRLISATHKDLQSCVDSGQFRQDLFYRINVIELHMPSLRDRGEDIPALVDMALKRLCGDRPPALSPAAAAALSKYAFPGNVRELENILERAVALCEGEVIHVDDLRLAPDSTLASGGSGVRNLQGELDELERQLIVDALAKTRGNRTAAAAELGVTFRSLRYRIDRLGIDVD